MGTLFLARDPKIGNRQVVIKVLREGFDTAEARERFQREANAAGALHHTNIVTIFDVGDTEGAPFIAMEFVDGETLTEMVRRRANFPLGRKIGLMEDLCAGLHFAHRAGVVHRDIKPANLMIDRDGVLKILDFGIARFGASKVTRTGIVVGTLNYMAPEQLGGQKLDPRADMFSSGAVFYEMLTGQQAFPAQVPAIFQQIMTASFEPLLKVAPEVPADLAAVVTRCLACNRDDRYPDMAAVKKELSAIRSRVALEEQQTLLKHLDHARLALKNGQPEDAMTAAQAALVLDSDCLPAQELKAEAAALSKKQTIDGHLAAARTSRAQGQLTSAALSVDLALAVDPASREALAERNAIAVERRRIAEERERAANIADAIGRARLAMKEEDYEGALRAASEALMIDEAHAESLTVKAEIEAAIAARREEERKARERAERQQRAREAVEDAKRQFSRGDHAGAIKKLEAFAPQTLVSTELEQLRAEAEAFAKRQQAAKEAAEQRKKQLEREAAERQQVQQAQTQAVPAAPLDQTASTKRVDPAALEQQAQSDRTVQQPQPDRTALTSSTIQIERTVQVDRAVAEAKSREAYQKSRTPAVDSPTIVHDPVTLPPQTLPPQPIKQAPPKPPLAPAAPQARTPWMAIGIGAAIVVAIVVGAAVKFWPRSTEVTTDGSAGPAKVAAPVNGTLVIDAVPWARIERIVNAKGEAQKLPDSSTPVALQLPAGEYRIELSGPPPSKDHREITVLVGSNATQVAPLVTFAEMSVDEYFRSQAERSR
jgi:serine/threonine-protein kinase